MYYLTASWPVMFLLRSLLLALLELPYMWFASFLLLLSGFFFFIFRLWEFDFNMSWGNLIWIVSECRTLVIQYLDVCNLVSEFGWLSIIIWDWMALRYYFLNDLFTPPAWMWMTHTIALLMLSQKSSKFFFLSVPFLLILSPLTVYFQWSCLQVSRFFILLDQLFFGCSLLCTSFIVFFNFWICLVFKKFFQSFFQITLINSESFLCNCFQGSHSMWKINILNYLLNNSYIPITLGSIAGALFCQFGDVMFSLLFLIFVVMCLYPCVEEVSIHFSLCSLVFRGHPLAVSLSGNSI